MQVHAVRFGPGDELLGALQVFVEERRLRAPFIITCVGSVTEATLRLANATATNTNQVPASMSGAGAGGRAGGGAEAATGRSQCLLPQVIHLKGRYEIVSLVGTLNPEAHLHICLSDGDGATVGGHVLGGLRVFTTAEVVIGEAAGLHFTREPDERTGFPELLVNRRPS